MGNNRKKLSFDVVIKTVQEVAIEQVEKDLALLLKAERRKLNNMENIAKDNSRSLESKVKSILWEYSTDYGSIHVSSLLSALEQMSFYRGLTTIEKVSKKS